MAWLGKWDVLRLAKEKDMKFILLRFSEPGDLYEAIHFTPTQPFPSPQGEGILGQGEGSLVKRVLGDDLFF